MKLTDNLITEALETLAAAFPWEETEIDIHREPAGKCRFVAVLPGDSERGLPLACVSANHPGEAVRLLIAREASKRADPEALRQRKLGELRLQVARLEAMLIGLPPYRPGCYLTNGAEPVPASEAVVNV